jgi:hypothetical protein
MTKFLKIFEILFLIALIKFDFIWTQHDHQNHSKQNNRGPSYKLTYFNARLRGEYIRWILAGKYKNQTNIIIMIVNLCNTFSNKI